MVRRNPRKMDLSFRKKQSPIIIAHISIKSLLNCVIGPSKNRPMKSHIIPALSHKKSVFFLNPLELIINSKNEYKEYKYTQFRATVRAKAVAY